MCGICGIVGGALDKSSRGGVVKGMMQALAHRGPDGEGFAAGPEYALGHRRLAVIDLERGAQPLWTADKRYVIIYNGAIYNYLELRQSLAREGIRFRTFSDTEVLLQLLVARGPEALPLCDGMFAFALYDTEAGVLTLGRDHVGIKPLYYTLAEDGGLAFASEIKALLLHPSVRARVKADALEEYLVLQLCLGDKTLFDGIYKLPPGTVMTFASGKPSAPRKWFSLDFSIDTDHTEAYFLDRLLLALQDSIKLQLRGDVAVGAYLSGGLDSSVVTSLAAAYSGERLHCFAGRFAEPPGYDESEYAAILAHDKNTLLHYITPQPQDFADWMPRIIRAMDEPVAGPGVFPQFLVSRLAREHVTVALGGQGGDEVFGGYARYLVAYLEQALRGAIFETHREGAFVLTLASIIPNLPVLRQYVPMLQQLWREDLFAPLGKRYFRLLDRSPDIMELLGADGREGLRRGRVVEAFSEIFEASEAASSINKMLAFDLSVTLPGLLQVEDRASMHSSLESRVPLLSPEILRLAASIPPTIKFKDGCLKYIFRESVKHFLPPQILDRKDKMGFPVPLSDWLRRGPVHDFACDILLSPTCRERGLFDTGALEKMLGHEAPHGRQAWGALCLELWFRTFIDAPQGRPF